jgi:anaerobic magnesium-protoporphyrin IX monomethyl ester cyclase
LHLLIEFKTESYGNAKIISKFLKEKFANCVVIVGGLHPSSMPEETLAHPYFDYVFIGEGEKEILSIYNKLKNKLSLSESKGIVYRGTGNIIYTPEAELVSDLNSLPPFPYHIFKHEKRYNFGHMISSRGCPYNCTFCCLKNVGKRRYRYKNAANTVAELELLATDYGQKEIAFFDDNFLANKNRIYELCETIRKSDKLKDCTYSFQARTRDMDKELLQEMHASGFKAVFFGVETVSDKILEEIGKDESHVEIENAIKLAQNVGFKVMTNFLFCLPGETKRVRKDCVDFAIRNNVDLAKFNNVVPYPGTVLYDQVKAKGKLEIKKDYANFNSQLVLIKSFWKRVPFPYLPESSTKYSMRQEIVFSYFRFYFRISIIKKILKDRSWGDAIFNVGKSKIDVLKKIPSIMMLGIDFFLKFVTMKISIFSKKGISFKDFINSLTSFFNK